MAKLIECRLADGRLYGYGFYCPACQELHHYYVAIFQPLWSFNGSMERPSFSPSLRMLRGNGCHLYVTDGQISYCGDSRHAFAGKVVPMVEYDVERGCPMDSLHTINGKPVDPATAQSPAVIPVGDPTVTATAAAVSTTHTAASGNVGATGQHGELGENGLS
jgi:hypothetical protein